MMKGTGKNLQKIKSYRVRSTWIVWEGGMRLEYEGYKWSKARIVSGTILEKLLRETTRQPRATQLEARV